MSEVAEVGVETPVNTRKRGRPRKEEAVAPDHSAALIAAMARMAEATEQIAKLTGGSLTAEGLANALETNRRASMPSNPNPNYNPPNCFEPQDVIKAKLVREVVVNNHPEHPSQLTPAEVDSYNMLSASLPNPGAVRTSRGGKWRAEIDMEGKRLRISFPSKGVDDQANGPKSIILLCRELTEGTPVASVDSMMDRMVALEAQNKMLMELVKKMNTEPVAASA